MARAASGAERVTSLELDAADMSLVDASGVRQLSDRLVGERSRSTDDSEQEFADPSLVVKLQRRRGREELEPPVSRRSETADEDEALGLFDTPDEPSSPPPPGGSLFDLPQLRGDADAIPIDDDDIVEER